MDAKAQPRTELNSEAIQDYAEAMIAGATFPPITVFRNGSPAYYLADGWHRVNAAKVARLNEIEADVHEGTLRDAILYSCKANYNNGLKRTNRDKRHAVETLLRDEEWSKRSDRWIAEQCGVTHPFVGVLREEVITVTTSNRIGTDGKLYPIPQRHIDAETGEILISPVVQAPVMPEPQATHEHKTAARPTFNRTNDNIDWAWWSWNPVTGCEFGCDYCYARDIANRFYPEGFKPTFHPERLTAPENTNPIVDSVGGRNVFVCSMADLFGNWVPNDWIGHVMRAVEANPQWNFLFLTKNPQRLASIIWPDNAWVGCTVDTQARVKPAEAAFRKINARVKWLSCEPMQERLHFDDIAVFDWIVMGGRSRSTGAPEFQPQWEWVYSLTQQATSAGLKVYWKPNLTVRPQEYPTE